MSVQILNGDTVALLKECNAGSKMATDSLEQIQPYVHTQKLNEMLHNYNEKHINIGEEIHARLSKAGEAEKDPNPMAKAFSWLSSQVKLTMDSSEKEVASLLIDGCNMGVKSLCEYKNKYSAADDNAVDICNRMIRMEKQMSDDLEKYL